MPRSFTFATIAEYKAAKASSGTVGAIYAELVSSGIKSGSCVSKITATGDVFIDSINPFVTPELGQEGDTLYYNSSEDTYRFLRAGNTTWDADSYGQVYIDLAKIPSGFSVVAPYTDIFNFKQTDENIGSGKASMTKILGNSVAWNQLCTSSVLYTIGFLTPNSSVTTERRFDCIYSGSASQRCLYTNTTIKVPTTHKAYVSITFKSNFTKAPEVRYSTGSGYDSIYNNDYVQDKWQTLRKVVTGFEGGTMSGILPKSNTYANGEYISVPNDKFFTVVDLTLLYGSSIDGLTDAQILAKFESEFPGYHSYNSGQLLSNKAKAIEFVGFNQWDEEWEQGTINLNTGVNSSSTHWLRSKNYIPVFASTDYHIHAGTNYGAGTYIYFLYYDANKNFISYAYKSVGATVCEKDFTIPANVAFLRFLYGDSSDSAVINTYNHDICINFSGKRNGQYEPYKKVVLPLPNLDKIKVYSHNLYNPATGKAKVEGGKQYYIGGTYTSISQNGTAITVSSHLFTPPASGDVDVVGGNSTDTIINLSSSFDGQYEPHGILTMEGGLKSAGSVRDEIVGNKYIKRIGSVDFGTPDWGIPSGAQNYFIANIPGIKTIGNTGCAYNIMSSKYESAKIGYYYANFPDKKIGVLADNSQRCVVKDTSFSDADSFKTAMQNEHVQLYYELATPIEYEIYSPTKMPFNWKYRVSEYHTKKMLPENGENPTSAPFACEIKQI